MYKKWLKKIGLINFWINLDKKKWKKEVSRENVLPKSKELYLLPSTPQLKMIQRYYNQGNYKKFSEVLKQETPHWFSRHFKTLIWTFFIDITTLTK